MAEIISKGGRSIRPDMTPMVDLGFLLITFFMYTTTFVQPHLMKYFQPKQDEMSSTAPMRESNTLSLILSKDNHIYWHQTNQKDLSIEKLKETSYSAMQVRKLILDCHKNAPEPENFTVIIKPTPESTYENLVDILDEMAITKTEHYAVVDAIAKENSLIAQNY